MSFKPTGHVSLHIDIVGAAGENDFLSLEVNIESIHCGLKTMAPITADSGETLTS
jgi:hypothetical protein